MGITFVYFLPALKTRRIPFAKNPAENRFLEAERIGDIVDLRSVCSR
ncbi:hypothetical protein AOP6_2328 [Desulfuromonas sp. AOP6]|nr:hypothetical protein AOP6_2328 [Desulfuromonas sp. AOP6]